MRLRRLIWNTVKDEHWFSGVRLWADILRARKAKRLRLARIERDIANLERRKAAEQRQAYYRDAGPQLQAMQNAFAGQLGAMPAFYLAQCGFTSNNPYLAQHRHLIGGWPTI